MGDDITQQVSKFTVQKCLEIVQHAHHKVLNHFSMQHQVCSSHTHTHPDKVYFHSLFSDFHHNHHRLGFSSVLGSSCDVSLLLNNLY